MRALTYGSVPVPWTASWSDEERFFLAVDPVAGRLAICQDEAPGSGRPLFGKPHAQRQRRAIAKGLCDLCAKTLDGRTKVSLSHAKVYSHGAEGPAVLQVEPLLHRECALVSMQHCPSLKRDIRSGELKVRQVSRYRVQMALMTAEYGAEIAGDARIAVGHAKVELLRWQDRDGAWLERAA